MSAKPLSRFGYSTLLLLLSVLLSGCATNSNRISPTILNTPLQVTAQPTEVPVSARHLVCLSKSLPDEIIQQFKLFNNYQLTTETFPGCAVIQPGPGDLEIGNWTYVVVAPFPTILDDLSISELISLWSSTQPTTTQFDKIYLTKDTWDFLSEVWGSPNGQNIRIINDHFLSDIAWKDKNVLAILPFDKIEPVWKVISVDGISPIHKDFNARRYALNFPISLVYPKNKVPGLPDQSSFFDLSEMGELSNRDPNELSTVIITGVTALVRGTASVMEIKGLTYPGMEIRDFLRDADITHINNEVPFAINCPPPFPREDNLQFCSKPKYIELLSDIGTDVVELSGDHFQDWGSEAMLYTLELYTNNNMKYYGGGRNLEDGRKPLKLDLGSNHIAFLGCNAKGPGYAGAGETTPGAVLCDFDFMHQQINELSTAGYLPIVTFQHLEYYDYGISPFLQADFQGMAEAGAVIVSGSQAHQPQGMEFVGNSFLHYGLGNLFFDQYKVGFPTRQAFIDRHVFYKGRYINTELITIMFMDMARPRLMTVDERKEVLTTVFLASGWSSEF